MKKQIYNLLDKKSKSLCDILDQLILSQGYTTINSIGKYSEVYTRTRRCSFSV